MRRYPVPYGAFIAVLLSACATAGGKVDATAVVATTLAPAQVGVVLGEGAECIYTGATGTEGVGLVAAVAAAVVPKLVDKGVAALTDYLEKRRERRSAELVSSYSSRGAGELYSRNEETIVSCLIVYRGLRGEPQGDPPGSSWTVDQLKGLGLASAPDFYLELRALYDASRTAFRLTPVRLEFLQTAARRSSGKKDVLVAGFFEQPFAGTGDTAAAARFGAFQVHFSDLPEGTTWGEDAMKGLTSQWIPLPAQPKNADGRPISTVPVSAFVSVTEAEEQGDLLLGVLGAVSEAVSESKDTISDKIANDILLRLGVEAGKVETSQAEPSNDDE